MSFESCASSILEDTTSHYSYTLCSRQDGKEAVAGKKEVAAENAVIDTLKTNLLKGEKAKATPKVRMMILCMRRCWPLLSLLLFIAVLWDFSSF